ncbi:MAG TPA: MBL fold metallo-hydrolase [Candidatus Limnocylindrales bacterium]|jgi:L-ascorbate metabolism protein UlaG (beta-lactamase superfamily)|nr:MBL fold metallo-hydrolase [Candidatus Limnocylindrales bacterium]
MTRLQWIGHSTVLIETGGRRLLTDPVLGQGIGPVRRRAGSSPGELGHIDAVLISHLHHDHLDLRSLRRLDREVEVLVPTGGGPLLRSEAFRTVHEVDRGDRLITGEVRVEATPARHSGRRAPFGPSGPALGYLIQGDHRIYFAGDTDIFAGMTDLARDLDIAILPIGGWGPTLRGGHMDPARAAAALALLRPTHAIAIHWGTLWPIGLSRYRRDRFDEPIHRFIEEAGRIAPDVHVAFLEPGGELVLPDPRRDSPGAVD